MHNREWEEINGLVSVRSKKLSGKWSKEWNHKKIFYFVLVWFYMVAIIDLNGDGKYPVDKKAWII